MMNLWSREAKSVSHNKVESKGQLYLKAGDGIIMSHHDINYAIDDHYEKPLGFIHNMGSCWITKSEFHAVNYYRDTGLADRRLKNRWDKVIDQEDYLYNLSKSVEFDVEIPKIKEGFELRPHQKVGIEFGNLTNGKFIIADQQRTGKSYTALIYALTQEWNRCLIVAPAKVVGIWANMINTICDREFKILKSNDHLVDGFNIISYDSLHTIENLDCDIAIADEAHFFLEKNARRSRAINSIYAPKKIALTGTPLMNSINDMLSILQWVDIDLYNEMCLFIKGLSKLKPYDQANIVGIELRRKCLLLRETSQVGTTTEPYINYIEIDAEINNPKDLQEIGRAKINYAVQYLKSFQNKILIVCHYRETGYELKARLGNKAVLVNGETPKSELDDSLRRFKDGEVQFLIGSSVLAEGIDLSHCSHILIMEESSYSMRVDQIRERCNNIHKQEEVIIDILRVKGCREDRVYKILNDKFSLQDGLRDS